MTLKDSYSTLSEAAKEFKVTRQTVARWVSDGDISAEKIGRETLIPKSEIERFSLVRMMSEDIEQLKERTISYIQKKYPNTESDGITLINFDGKSRAASLTFSSQTKGNKYEIININIGRPDPIVEEDDSFITVGMKIPVLKIIKRKSSKAEVAKMVTKQLRRVKEERKKKYK